MLKIWRDRCCANVPKLPLGCPWICHPLPDPCVPAGTRLPALCSAPRSARSCHRRRRPGDRMPWGGSGWSKSFLCDLERFSSAWLSPAVGDTRLVCPQCGVLSRPLTSENSFRLLQGLLQPSLRDAPQPDLGVLTRCARRDGQCLMGWAGMPGALGDSGQGWHAHTHSEAPRVERVPGEVGHGRAVLDGGDSHVGEAAGLGELRVRARVRGTAHRAHMGHMAHRAHMGHRAHRACRAHTAHMAHRAHTGHTRHT